MRGKLLRISLVLNVSLIVALAVIATRRSDSAPSIVTKTMPDESHIRAIPPREQPVPAAIDTGTHHLEWIACVRAAGLADNVLARMVQVNFEERWQKRLEELQERYDRGEIEEDQDWAALNQEHDVELDRELHEALGEDGFQKWNQENTLASLNLRKAGLSTDETGRICDWQKELQRQFRALDKSEKEGQLDHAEATKQREELQSAFDQRIKTLLGDQRYAETKGDGEARELRRNLRTLNPSDTQFDQLLEAQKHWAEQRAELDRQLQQNKFQGAAYEEQIQAIDAAREGEYQRVLGTNGYNLFQRNQDWRYSRMTQNAKAWSLENEQIDYCYSTLKYYEKVTADYRNQANTMERQGEAMDWDAINQNLSQFSQQTARSLRDYLGEDRFRKMKQSDLWPFDE
jgi:plasmid maintenance system killer protein